MKVAIVGGAGGVGASVAFNLLLAEGFEVAVVDRHPEMVTSHVMDLEQVLEQRAAGSVRAGDEADVAAADVVVLAAAAPLTVNTSRMVYLADNAAILCEAVAALPAHWGGVLLVVTNPVDPLCTWLAQRLGLSRGRLLGYTLNDTLRLRTGVARALGARPGSVSAWAIGEHGDRAVLLWDRVEVDGSRVTLTAAQRASAEEFVRTWYVRHVALDSGRSSTWTSGLGVARMIDAIARDSGELFPASVVLAGEYGIEGVALSVPVSLGRGGAQRIHEWDLAAPEHQAMFEAAAFVRTAAGELAG